MISREQNQARIRPSRCRVFDLVRLPAAGGERGPRTCYRDADPVRRAFTDSASDAPGL